MWFESLLVFILFKLKKRPNIFGIWVVRFMFNTTHSCELSCNVCFIARGCCDYQQRAVNWPTLTGRTTESEWDRQTEREYSYSSAGVWRSGRGSQLRCSLEMGNCRYFGSALFITDCKRTGWLDKYIPFGFLWLPRSSSQQTLETPPFTNACRDKWLFIYRRRLGIMNVSRSLIPAGPHETYARVLETWIIDVIFSSFRLTRCQICAAPEQGLE